MATMQSCSHAWDPVIHQDKFNLGSVKPNFSWDPPTDISLLIQSHVRFVNSISRVTRQLNIIHVAYFTRYLLIWFFHFAPRSPWVYLHAFIACVYLHAFIYMRLFATTHIVCDIVGENKLRPVNETPASELPPANSRQRTPASELPPAMDGFGYNNGSEAGRMERLEPAADATVAASELLKNRPGIEKVFLGHVLLRRYIQSCTCSLHRILHRSPWMRICSGYITPRQ